MDIFAIAEQGTKIQEEEKQALIEEEAAEKAAKSFKMDIKLAMAKAAQKDYTWLSTESDGMTPEEKDKGFQPFMLNMWMGMITTKNPGRNITSEDEGYFEIIQRVNTEMNANLFSASKEMNWLLACTVNPFNLSNFPIQFVKKPKREAELKYDNRVIKYMANELWSSEDKIYDMIEAGLISAAEMKEIGKDLDTLEDPKKKKK